MKLSLQCQNRCIFNFVCPFKVPMLVALLIVAAVAERNQQIMSKDAFEKYLRFLVRRQVRKVLDEKAENDAQRNTIMKLLSHSGQASAEKAKK